MDMDQQFVMQRTAMRERIFQYRKGNSRRLSSSIVCRTWQSSSRRSCTQNFQTRMTTTI